LQTFRTRACDWKMLRRDRRGMGGGRPPSASDGWRRRGATFRRYARPRL